MTRSAIVIGAGVIGVASAYALARRGWCVTLLDRESGPAMGTSHANGAQLSYCYTDAVGNPALLASLPKLLGGRGGVTMRWTGGLDYYAWLARFAVNCTAGAFRRNTLAVLDLADQSRSAMDALRDRHDLQFKHRVAGKVHLLYSPETWERAEAVRTLKQSAGVEQHILPREQMAQLDPSLSGLDPDVTGVISTPSEVVGDPLLFCRALTQVLERDYGATILMDAGVESIAQGNNTASVTLNSGEKLHADAVVVASGTDSNRLLAPLGAAVPIQPMKGYSFEMPATDRSPRISVTDGKRRLVITNLGDRMRVAGIAELGKSSRAIDPARIEWLRTAAMECMPEAGDYRQSGNYWTGLRPTTPSSQPYIRHTSANIAVNTGHGALGWTLAMGSGEKLAKLLEMQP
ncbi:MAG: FAD-dependent oxidoreductase [Erythrobacter sp.]